MLYYYNIDNTAILQVSSTKYLGITISNDLTGVVLTSNAHVNTFVCMSVWVAHWDRELRSFWSTWQSEIECYFECYLSGKTASASGCFSGPVTQITQCPSLTAGARVSFLPKETQQQPEINPLCCRAVYWGELSKPHTSEKNDTVNHVRWKVKNNSKSTKLTEE